MVARSVYFMSSWEMRAAVKVIEEDIVQDEIKQDKDMHIIHSNTSNVKNLILILVVLSLTIFRLMQQSKAEI